MQHTRPDNYAIMAEQARLRFLTYDQQMILNKSPVKFDESYIDLPVLDTLCRVSRETGHVTWLEEDTWQPSPRRHDILTVYDYLCDASPDRCLTGDWRSTAALGSHVHTGLNEEANALETTIDENPDTFRRICGCLGGIPFPHCDIGFTLQLFPDLPITLQFWHSDEEFPPRLRFLWDSNTCQYIRYETTYYALGLIQSRLNALMERPQTFPHF